MTGSSNPEDAYLASPRPKMIIMKKLSTLALTLAISVTWLAGQAPAGGPTVTFPNLDGSYFEGAAFCPNVNITNPDADTTKVTIAVAVTSTATQGTDFTVSVVTMVFPPFFSGNQSFCIFTTDDPNYEQVESIQLRLRNATNGASINDSMYNADIWDNDSTTSTNPCTDLFISEYIHSLSNGSRVIEIFNPTNLPVNLSNYSLKLYYNGSSTAGTTIILSGTLLPDNAFVLCNSGADPDILALADMTSLVLNFTGDDAVGLYNGATPVDIVGIIGNDPGNSWPAASFGFSTASSVLVREPTVFVGDTDWHVSAANWTYYDQDSTSFLGNHTMLPCGFSGPTVFVLTSDAETTEGAGLGISLGLADPNSDTTYVDLVVEPSSTANHLADFGYAPLTVKFPPGSTSQTVGISIVDDAVAELRENFTLKLTNPQNPAGVLMGDSLWFCRIYDNDTFLTNLLCQTLFFSELDHSYGDDTRALEIYNPTPNTVNLTGHEIRIFEDGHTVADSVITLTGNAASGDVFVIANPTSPANVLAVADQQSSSLQWSQHSVLELVRPGNFTIDQIGVKGETTLSGSGWAVSIGGSTGSSTLVRRPYIQQGQPWATSMAHWNVYPDTNHTFLGAHTMDSCIIPPPTVGYMTPNISAPEDTGTVTVSVAIANPPPVAMTVDVVVDVSSTATSGTDASFTPATLTFPGGAPGPQTFTVTVTDDAQFEADETLTLRLTNASNPNAIFVDSVWTLTIVNNDPSGISEAHQPVMTLAPNPAHDVLMITVSSGERWSLQVLDVTGRLVLDQQELLLVASIDVAQLPNGVYVARISAGDTYHSQRFVKE